jgi:hypothetical protein
METFFTYKVPWKDLCKETCAFLSGAKFQNSNVMSLPFLIPEAEIRKPLLGTVWPFLESVEEGKSYLKILRFGKVFPQF